MDEVSSKMAPEYEIEDGKKRSPVADILTRFVREKPLGTVGAVLVLLLLLTGIFAEFLAPYRMNEIHLLDSLRPPSANYILGTDNLGRDILSRIIYGARISLYVGLGGSALCTIVAVVIGLVSGFFGGKTDILLQRFVDAWMCFPPLFMYLTLVALIGAGLLNVILVLGIVRGVNQSRVIRGAVMSAMQNQYIEASKAIGCSNLRILVRHILPNIMAPIIIVFTASSGYVIISEATLSFLGFGVPPPTPSWGGMLTGAGRQYMYQAPWMALWPGAALAIAVYGLNMFGDAVRDILDPRLRGGLGRYGKAKVKKI